MQDLPNLSFEQQYSNHIIAGVDEAGRGPLAGPVVAAAVIVDQNNIIPGIKDSKKISLQKREALYKQITNCYHYGIGIIDAAEIDQINILEATKKACINAVLKLKIIPSLVIVDGNMKFSNPKFNSIIKGDNTSISIAAASIVAKVTRDQIMKNLDKIFPAYKWAKNFGYGTKEHISAIKLYGYSPYHRMSFKSKHTNC